MNPAAEALVDRILSAARREPGLSASDDYRVTRQLLLDCIGDRTVSPRWIFWRCACGRTRCNREVAQFPFCLCGSRETRVEQDDMNTARAAQVLQDCLRRERAEARTSFTP